MGFFSNEEFIRYKKCTQPVYQTPASIQQMLDIAGVHENGIFEIEPNNGAGKKRRKFDRVYSFSDLNYVDQDNNLGSFRYILFSQEIPVSLLPVYWKHRIKFRHHSNPAIHHIRQLLVLYRMPEN